MCVHMCTHVRDIYAYMHIYIYAYMHICLWYTCMVCVYTHIICIQHMCEAHILLDICETCIVYMVGACPSYVGCGSVLNCVSWLEQYIGEHHMVLVALCGLCNLYYIVQCVCVGEGAYVCVCVCMCVLVWVRLCVRVFINIRRCIYIFSKYIFRQLFNILVWWV